MSSITFTLIQTTLHWENKKANLQMLEEKIKTIKEKTQVVILPEMFSTGFSMKPEALAETMDGETVNWMKRVTTEKKVILTGSVIIGEEEKYYNRLIWMLPNGEYGYYNKRHLFAYAEEDKHYTAGTDRFISSVNGWKVNLQVCYDLRFPVWARQTSLPAPLQQVGEGSRESRRSPSTALLERGLGGEAFEYDVLIYVANWPEKRSLAWKTLLQARAIENQCYVIGVNRVGEDGNGIYHSGDSMVIDPLGEILYHKKNEEDIFTITLEKKNLEEIRERFQFWRDGDAFKILT
ncbi:MAG: nitrilase family protein [Bacteroidota bacterium]|nr:nitrilase family protein [Bacteroidota bacterium]